MTAHWTPADIPDLSGRTAVVTGANSGLGEAATRELAARGATVLMACRNPQKADAAAARITGDVQVVPLDLASLASVRALAAELRSTRTQLDLLVNNAGLMAVDESHTEDGFEMQFGVNHLGHFVLTAELAPLLASTPGSRVATMASMGHRMGRLDLDDPMFERRRYRRWPAYFQSKLCNILFTTELQRRFADAGVPTIAVAAHPGGSHTDLGTEGSGLTNKAMSTVVPAVTQSAEAGAHPLLRAATDPAVQGGEFYGPRAMVWGRAVRETPSRRARRPDDARGLWELSERLTGVTFDPRRDRPVPGAG